MPPRRSSIRRIRCHTPRLQHHTASHRRRANLRRRSRASRIPAWPPRQCRDLRLDTVTALPPHIPRRLTLEAAIPTAEMRAVTMPPRQPTVVQTAAPIALPLRLIVRVGPTLPHRPTARELAHPQPRTTRLRRPRILPAEAAAATPPEGAVVRMPQVEATAGRL